MSQENPSPRNRALKTGMAIVAGIVLISGTFFAWRFWNNEPVVSPPNVPLEGVDSSVAKAIRFATEGVEARPYSAQDWGRLGHVLRAHGFEAESQICYTQAEKFEPDNPTWPYLQASQYAQNAPEKALPKFRRAVEVSRSGSDKHTTALIHLAEILMKLNRLEKAATLLQSVQEYAPEHPLVHFNLGLIHRKQNRLQKAATHLRQVMESPFAQKKACTQLAAVYARLQNRKEAELFARRARRLPSDVSWSNPFVDEYLNYEVGAQNRYSRAEKLQKQGRIREALQILRQEVDQAPSAKSFVNYGIALAKVGDHERAEQMLTAAVSEAPHKVQAHYFLGVVAYFQGQQLQKQGQKAEHKFEQTVQRTRRALKLKPDHGQAHLFLGLALKQLSQREAALDEFQAAARCRPELPDVHRHLGEALIERERVREGIAQLELAVQLASPNDQSARRALEKARKKLAAENQ